MADSCVQMPDLTILPDGRLFLCNGAQVGESCCLSSMLLMLLLLLLLLLLLQLFGSSLVRLALLLPPVCCQMRKNVLMHTGLASHC